MDRSREFARELLAKAQGDGWVVARLIDDADAPVWVVGFHAQQATEKAIKAVMAHRGIEYPLTHNLGALLDLLRDRQVDLPADASKLPQLTPFGVMLRYPDEREVGEGWSLDRKWARGAVDRTLQWAAAIIGLYGQRSEPLP
ncbi:MAG: HEPN domain-containing protein [Phycisphaeraceae bacterium]|nr:HEPN domain-containing protein [Phycisphaeraceae bacterium]